MIAASGFQSGVDVRVRERGWGRPGRPRYLGFSAQLPTRGRNGGSSVRQNEMAELRWKSCMYWWQAKTGPCRNIRMYLYM